MSAFLRALSEVNPTDARRRWVYLPYDQLSDRIGLLARLPPDEVGIVLVETPAKPRARPYHKRKLALVLANQRHFAVEQARRGVRVAYLFHPDGYAPALQRFALRHGPLVAAEPAERELRLELQRLVQAGSLSFVEHEGWLTRASDFASLGGPPWRMDRFYRGVRQRTGILMRDGKPLGGRYSLDGENREPWKGEPPAPQAPEFPSDPIKDEVVRLVEERFAHHPGRLDPATLPVTLEDAEVLWRWVLEHCLPCFGPYEDAMAAAEPFLFHTRIAELLHLHRLLPARVVRDVEGSEAPLNSREGFVRQVLGWREFVRHVHRATDGFTRVDVPSDPGLRASPNQLEAYTPLPAAFWPGSPSGLHCLDTVVEQVWAHGYSHHITRLMVLSNLATLLDVSPRELTDWFWVAYSDAYDWVVEPNVLGMGTFAVGELMTTKPYVSGSNYLRKMSDYCGGCAFDPKKDCPVTSLYWAFLERKRELLEGNRRLSLPLASARKRSAEQKEADAATFERVVELLEAGETLHPEQLVLELQAK